MSRKPQTDASRVVAYIRVSTDEQALGPEAQRASIERWCEANGATLVAVHEDLGVSGGATLDKRPGLVAAIDALADHGAGVLLAMKRDRLARDVMVAAMVERLADRAGARVLTADGAGNGEGPEAALMRTMMNAFAEYERQIIRSRTKAALAVKKGRGERTGEIPFGYRLDADGVHLVADDAEQEVIALVRQYQAEALSIRKIADRLNAEGRCARGSQWHPTTVARLLKRIAG